MYTSNSFPNLTDDPDPVVAAQELVTAGLADELDGWTLTRRWYYWSATGPSIAPAALASFDAQWGREVRAHGFAGGEGIKRMDGAVDTFHIDTPRGLVAFATLARRLATVSKP